MNALAGLRMLEKEDEEEDDAKEEEMVQEEKGATEDVMTSVSIIKKEGDEVESDKTSEPISAPTPSPPKPLKSILKKRKPESVPAEAVVEVKAVKDDPILEKKPNFGGSIAQALKRIKEATPSLEELEKKKKEPEPSDFIREMEKQRDSLPVLGTYGFPSRDPVIEDMEISDVVWGDNTEVPVLDGISLAFPQQFKNKQKKDFGKTKKQKKANLAKAKANLPKESEECVVMITNLPFKMTRKNLVLLLGVWPKGGYDGVHLVAEGNGLPAGYAYIVLERHSDMMDVIRMSGLMVKERKIKVIVSTHKALKRDIRSTRKALKAARLSRVIRVAQLPFTLTKKQLCSIVDCVSFKEDDIYWKPLKKNQTNSGRGYIVIESSKDAWKFKQQKYVAQGRVLEVGQVHPEEMIKFCDQCKMNITHELSDPMPDEFLKELDEAFAPDAEVPSSIDLTEEVEEETKVAEKKVEKGPEKEHSDIIFVIDDSDDAASKSKVITPSKAEDNNVEKDMDIDGNSSNESNDSDANSDKKTNKPEKKAKKKSRLSGTERKRRNLQNQRLKKALKEINERRPEALPPPVRHMTPREVYRGPPESSGGSGPPFKPTVHVRMYNVPDKSDTVDIRNFFAPILPAKIAQNIGYDIYDIEFYNPDDAWDAMRKHNLLMRKNPIKLEMLPGPPMPLPPRPDPPRRPRSPEIPDHGPPPMPPMVPPMGPGPMHMHPGMGSPMGGMPLGPNMGPRPMLPFPPVLPPNIPPMGPPPNVRPMGGVPLPIQPGFGPPPMIIPPLSSIPPIPPVVIPPPMAVPGYLPPMTTSNRTVEKPPISYGMPPPMHSSSNKSYDSFDKDSYGTVQGREQDSTKHEADNHSKSKKKAETKKELIPVPPLPKDFLKYKVPKYDPEIPVGQGVITPMEGYFCQLCNKFYSSRTSAKVAHCKSKGHYDKLKQFLQEKKRLRRLAETTD